MLLITTAGSGSSLSSQREASMEFFRQFITEQVKNLMEQDNNSTPTPQQLPNISQPKD